MLPPHYQIAARRKTHNFFHPGQVFYSPCLLEAEARADVLAQLSLYLAPHHGSVADYVLRVDGIQWAPGTLLQLHHFVPSEIREDSWLNTPEYNEFSSALDFAAHGTQAQPILASITPEQAYILHTVLTEGARRYRERVQS
jgi:hypothetical protein